MAVARISACIGEPPVPIVTAAGIGQKLNAKQESSVMAQATLNNQRTIIANERVIISNQKKLLKNQETLKVLVGNQVKIMRNQDAIVKNQKKILANQSRILKVAAILRR